MSHYPEHQKLKRVMRKTQFVHDFLEFCNTRDVFLGKEMTDGSINHSFFLHADLDKLIYAFIEVDPKKLEAEKRAMIESCRKARK